MALQLLALAPLLALCPLLSAQGGAWASPGSQGEATTPEKCPKPHGAWPLGLEPNKLFYGQGELVTLSCPAGLAPSEPVISCVRQGSHSVWNATVACLKQCRAPEPQDARVQFTHQQPFYSQGASVTWSCPAGYQPSPPEIRCLHRGSQPTWSGTPACTEKCPRPQGDPRLRLAPDRPFYSRDDWVALSCPEGAWASPSRMTCVRRGPSGRDWNAWAEQDSRGVRRLLAGSARCVANPRISGDLDVSATSIKLHWICEPPESCQGSWKLQARCRPDGPPTGPCGRPGNTKEQPLQGAGGAVTCSPLQPFSSYNVTISGSDPATRPARTAVLYSRRVTTRETAPGPPETEPLDLREQTFRWKPLPPCHGEILGYQLNVTARRAYDSSFHEAQEVRVPPSATEYRPPHWRHGTNYTVTVQGLTAAGPGQASSWDFETDISDTCRRAGGWTAEVTFPSEQETFRVNETVQVRCHEEPAAGPFPATCVELKGRGAVWDISAVTCLSESWIPQPGGATVAVAVAVVVPVVLVILAAGALLLLCWSCHRKRQAPASHPAKDAGDMALYEVLQPRDASEIYCTLQTQAHGAAD